MNVHTPADETDEAAPPSPSMHPLRKIAASQGSDPSLTPLPFDTATGKDGRVPSIATHHSTPRVSPPRLRPRLYELEEAPTFFPTTEEFADPLRYIQYVGDPQGGNGKAYGIVKIVPPAGWNPEFVLNQDVRRAPVVCRRTCSLTWSNLSPPLQRFRFRTRMQRLNSLSADARASLNYQEQLQKFHAQQGHARVSIPVVDRRPVDLYNLKLNVNAMGGHETVARARRWAEVTRKLGYDEKDACHLAAQIKAAYTRIILPFEKFLAANREAARKEGQELKQRTTSPEQQGVASVPGPPLSASPDLASTSAAQQAHFPSPAFDDMDTDRSLDESEASKRRSSRKRVDSTKMISSSGLPLRSRQNTSPHSETNGKADYVIVPGAEEQMCEICLRGDNGTAMLLCDECNRGYHMYCLDPPLTAIPKSQWYCPPCLVGTGNDYGFDDGETHSLSSFFDRAESFRSAWWNERPDHIWKPSEGRANGLTRPVAGTELRVSEDDVEREFWRLVHNPDETVEVEYGADVHSTTHGSALPTLETCPLSPYARDGWNLNNLPILPGSLLRYIKSDISGMTVPWIYIGMIFSTFCWHNEDHHTYSINYQHFGDTKTWYGVPGADAHLLEEALRAAAPDLFEQSPDLLFQLVTMMSPDKLKKHGVRVYACDQRANEFVITYPKAYHAGFNHGFNLNEAVNFALPDWIDFGLESVRRYQQFKRFPVFSHDELVVTVYQQNQSVDTAMWLQSPMEEMVKREIEKRNELRRLVPNISELVEEVDKPEPEYQCAHCNVFCYLGQIVSDKAEGVACLDHGHQVCGVDSPTRWTLRTRFSDETLTTMLAKTVERAAIPVFWKSRLHKLIVSSPRPNLRNLRGLLHEGDKIPFKMAEVDELRLFVEKANKWVDEATWFIARKHQKRSGTAKEVSTLPKRGKRVAKSTEEEEGGEGQPEEAGEQDRVYALLAEAELLPFDAPEIGALKGVVEAMQEFQRRTTSILGRVRNNDPPRLVECEEVLSLGNSLNVKFEELDELQNYVAKRKWVEEVLDIQENYTNLAEVKAYLAEGRALGLGPWDELMVLLEERRDAGLDWKKRAEAVLGVDRGKVSKYVLKYTQDDAEELLRASYKVAIVPDLHVKVENMLKHVREWTRQCEMLVNPDTIDHTDEMGVVKRYVEACRLLSNLEDVQIVMKHEHALMQMKSAHEAWERRVSERIYHEKAWDPSMAQELALRIKGDYLAKAEGFESDAQGEGGCLCRGRSGRDEQGAIITCAGCFVDYHSKCVRLDKRTAKDKSWRCPFCEPHKLQEFAMVLQRSKPSLKDFDDLLASMPSDGQPWGESATHRYVGKTATLVRRLAATLLPPQRPMEDVQKTSYLLKKILWCPLRFDDRLVFSFVDSIIELHHRREVLRQQQVKESARPPAPSWRSFQVDPVPAYKGESMAAHSSRLDEMVRPAVPDTDRRAHNGDLPAPEPVGDESQRDVSLNMTGDYSDGEDGALRVESSIKEGRLSSTNDDRKRKRGKRAKFVFEEEVGIFVPVHGVRVYCLCHQPESGTMVSCERCSLWFHNSCVHVTAETDLGEERWICPMCCVKTERRYTHAEVKVKGMDVTDPNLWLDVRATLRSTKGPVNKLQHWSAEPHKRIVLHLESFYPATLPTTSDSAKRPRLNDGSPGPRHARGESNSSGGDAIPYSQYALGSVRKNPSWNDVKARVTPVHRTPLAEEKIKTQTQQQNDRHQAGMANLYARGVTDAMIKKWFVGWNGRYLVYPRQDRFGVLHELVLGTKISLAPDDQDGTRLINSILQKEADEKRWGDTDRGANEPIASPEKGSSGIANGAQAASSSSAAVQPLSPPMVSSRPRLPPTHPPPSMPRISRPSWHDQATQPLPPPPSIHHQQPAHRASHPRSPAAPIFPPPSLLPFRGPPAVLPPPLPSFTSRSPATTEAARSPALGARGVSQQQPPPPPPPPSSSSAAALAIQSPRSSPYFSARPLAHSREGTPRTPNIVHSTTQPPPSSASSPPAQLSPRPSMARVDSTTPEKSLDEYRSLARKMRPGASEEEIEMMARHAMS